MARDPNSTATSAFRNSDPIDVADRRFERLVAQLYSLGARAVCELLIEVGVQTMHMITIEQALTRYAALDPETLRVLDGDQFPPYPDLRAVGHEP